MLMRQEKTMKVSGHPALLASGQRADIPSSCTVRVTLGKHSTDVYARLSFGDGLECHGSAPWKGGNMLPREAHPILAQMSCLWLWPLM